MWGKTFSFVRTEGVARLVLFECKGVLTLANLSYLPEPKLG